MDITTNLYIQLALCVVTFIAIFLFIRVNSKNKSELSKHKKN